MDRLYNQEFRESPSPKLEQQLLEISLLSNWLRRASEISGSHASNPGEKELVFSETYGFGEDNPETLDTTKKSYTIKTTHPPVISVTTKQHGDLVDFLNSNSSESSSQPTRYTQTKYEIKKDGVLVTTTNLLDGGNSSLQVSFDDPQFTQTVSNLHSHLRSMTISEFNYSNTMRPSAQQINSLLQVATEIAFKQQHLFKDKPVSNTYQYKTGEPGKTAIDSNQFIPSPTTISIRSIHLSTNSPDTSAPINPQTAIDQFYTPNSQLEGEIIQFNLPRIPTLSTSWGTLETKIPSSTRDPHKTELTAEFLTTRPDLIKAILDNIFYLNPAINLPQASLN